MFREKINIVEVVGGVLFFIFILYLTLNAFNSFAGYITGHLVGKGIDVGPLVPYWRGALVRVFRLVFLAFVAGLLVAHGAIRFREAKETGRVVRARGREQLGIVYKGTSTVAELLEEKAPVTAKTILEMLPIEGKAEIEGPEVYFRVPVEIGPENQTLDPRKGDLVYYPSLKAIGMFFEDTKASAPVNVFGKIRDVTVVSRISAGEPVSLRKE